MFFAANDGVSGTELFAVSNSSSQPVLIPTSLNNGGGSFPRNLTVYNGKLFFVGIDNNGYDQLWSLSDADSVPRAINQNIVGSDCIYSASIKDMVVYNNVLFLNARFNDVGEELWSYDDNGINAITSISTNHFLVYPNPSNGMFRVTIPTELTLADVEVVVTDVLGCHVFLAQNFDVREVGIDISTVPDGMYLLQIRKNNTTIATKKLIKLRN